MNDPLLDTADAVLALCSHVCRYRPKLKLNPKHCEARKHKSMAPAGSGIQSLWECSKCDGPLPVESVEVNGPMEAVKEDRRQRLSKNRPPDKCNRCGKAAEDTEWYPSNRYTCKPCLRKREEEVRSESTKLYSELPEEVLEQATCRACGEKFVPYQHGCTLVKTKCKTCISDKAQKTILTVRGTRLSDPYVVVVDLSNEMEIFERLMAVSKRERRSIDMQALVMIETILKEEEK